MTTFAAKAAWFFAILNVVQVVVYMILHERTKVSAFKDGMIRGYRKAKSDMRSQVPHSVKGK